MVRRRKKIAVGLTVLIVLGFSEIYRRSEQTVAFHAPSWTALSTSSHDRYRLAQALAKKAVQEKWSRATVVDNAGLPEGADGSSWPGFHIFCYDAGEKTAIFGRHQTLMLWFDQEGNVTEAQLVGQ